MGMKSLLDSEDDLGFMEYLYAMLRFFGKKVVKQSLPQEEADSILLLIPELRKERNSAEQYREIYDKCRDTIEEVLKRNNYCPIAPKAKLKTLKDISDKPMTKLPGVVKMLIYYMAYRAFELYENTSEVDKKKLARPSQVGILNYIGRMEVVEGKKIYKGYRLSNKTFTYFGISPKAFYDINHYRQVELPMSYAGAKGRYLGYIINYLASYAGIYDCFVDLFGGAGFASLAVSKQDTVKYIINEKDFFNINFFRVLADDELYLLFSKEMEKLCQTIKEQKYDVAFGREKFIKYKNEGKDFRESYPLNTLDELKSDDKEEAKKHKKYENYKLWLSETNERRAKAAVGFAYIHSFTISSGNSEEGGVNEKALKRFCNYDLSEFNKLHQCLKRMKKIYNCDALDIKEEFIIEYMAEKYSKVLYYSDSPYLKTAGYPSGSIENDEMRQLIGRLMQISLKGNHFIFSCRATKSIENKTYTDIELIFKKKLKKFEHDSKGNVLLDIGKIYEDEDYIDGFGERRYAIAETQVKKVLSLLKENQEIYKNIFCEFCEKAKEIEKELYALVCVDMKVIKKLFGNELTDEDNKKVSKDRMVEEMLKLLLVTEVFITDFDYITPLGYQFYNDATKNKKKAKPKQECTFVKYKLDEFCDLMKHHLFRSELYDNVVVKKEGEGYVFKYK